jgi:ribonuclease Z
MEIAMSTRVAALVAIWLGMGLLGGVGAPQAAEPDFRVTLLGTGAPPPSPTRFGPATLVEAGSQKLVFDVGRGAPIRLWQIRVPLSEIDAVFLTHFHSDHVVGIPDMWLSGWLGGPFARRKTPFHVIGPIGTQDLMSNLERAYAADIRIRVADEHYPLEGIRVIAEEFANDGVVYEKDGVRVTAFEVDHGEQIKPAVGYRIDYDGRSVVISGDTRLNENVVAMGTGTDLLIHEVAAVKPELLADAQVSRVMQHHTSPQEAGTVFSRARPRLAAYTHLVLLARGEVPSLTPEELIAQTRETYDGPLEVGQDLMTFDIGPDDVSVLRRMPAR